MAANERIFLAHAFEDKDNIRELYLKLRSEGYSPWFDEIDLKPGQEWKNEIPKAIREAAICLACLSKISVAKRGYVQREFRLALSTYAELPVGSRYLIPVRLDECKIPEIRIPSLDISMADFHCADLSSDDGFESLMSSITDILGIRDFKKSLVRFNRMYNDTLRNAKINFERRRVILNGQKGYVQSVHVNAGGVRVDIILDSGFLAMDVDALTPEYDPR
jgi:hypothetical protein